MASVELEGARAPRGGGPASAAPFPWSCIIGGSPAIREVKALLVKIAAAPDSTVLLVGESGTGKDLIAKAIHHNGARAARPFQNVTCSALPEALLESELFGHEQGAFTDAKQRKKGLLEIAHGGTVFLDEIGDTRTSLQVKLLRFLEDRAFRRVGGFEDIQVDVRVIAATNRNLEEAIAQGAFRTDLYYRLRVLPVLVPPLRERHGDIAILAEAFLRAAGERFRRPVLAISPAALAALEAHSWPGNVRELKNVVERAVLLAEEEILVPRDFVGLGAGPRPEPAPFVLPAGGLDFSALERDLVRQALALARGNKTRAARLLGWNRDQIRYRMAKFGMRGDAGSPEARDLPRQ